jgi:hypothetical protein
MPLAIPTDMESSTIEGFKPKDYMMGCDDLPLFKERNISLVMESNYLARNKHNSPILFSTFASLVVCIVQCFFITQPL